jgi:hypothetical protein
MSSGPRSGKRIKPNKLGRNDPCFCGSGIKYKKCCLPKGLTPPQISQIPQEVIDQHEQNVQKRQSFLHSKGIYINLPNTITFKGQSLLAVGNGIMLNNNPHATFHQLVFDNLARTLGKEWWDDESVKPADEKHYIKHCYDELQGSDTRYDLDIEIIDEHTRTMLATGNTQSLLSLAFDVWLLTQKGYMRDDWLNRLRDREAYQGVRYEIGVASLFVRMGCDLEFYDNDKLDGNGHPPKRAEFIAVHPLTKNRVAVEAKSRHVAGVIHMPGTMNYRSALKGDITSLYRKALLKQTDGLPLIVFIDVNSPTEVTQTVQTTQWFSDVKRSFDSRPSATAENPDKYAAVFVTNFSSHYQGNDVSHSGQYLFIGSLLPEHPLMDGYQGEFMKRLLRATGGYGYVPPSMDNDKFVYDYDPSSITSTDDFIKKLRRLTAPNKSDPDHARKEAENNKLIDMLVWDAKQKSGGDGKWDNEIATDCFKQFEWLYKQP